jgi:hypothetical protein
MNVMIYALKKSWFEGVLFFGGLLFIGFYESWPLAGGVFMVFWGFSITNAKTVYEESEKTLRLIADDYIPRKDVEVRFQLMMKDLVEDTIKDYDNEKMEDIRNRLDRIENSDY